LIGLDEASLDMAFGEFDNPKTFVNDNKIKLIVTIFLNILGIKIEIVLK